MARPLAPRGHGRERVVDAALELFAQHGVSGTSLQMIADHLGVTKAAVYYQFKAKEDIVLAVLEPAFRTMRDFIAEAEAAPSPAESSERAMAGLVGPIIEQREGVAPLFPGPQRQTNVEGPRGLASPRQRARPLAGRPPPPT